MINFCCKQMEYHIKKGEKLILYDRVRRFYALNFSKSTVQMIDFCPWCGIQLPKNLYDVWFSTLEELGIEDPISNKDIPEEFKTDEWWKKRGL